MTIFGIYHNLPDMPGVFVVKKRDGQIAHVAFTLAEARESIIGEKRIRLSRLKHETETLFEAWVVR